MIDIQQATSSRAYALWEKEGRPDGRDLEHWLEAERIVAGEAAAFGARHSEEAAIHVSAAPHHEAHSKGRRPR
jgi:Protein of unknown function (DUF2934)